ncbi:MAG: sulfotransferase [Acidimicrobiales bacterium]
MTGGTAPKSRFLSAVPAPVARVLTRAANNLDLPSQALVSARMAVREGGQRFADLGCYCIFIGYPRSGHSLVGSLIDAHPDAVVAHELDALRLVGAGFSRSQVFSLILANSQAHGPARQHVYDYSVPDQWQGRYRRLLVIGDKKGGRSTRRLAESPRLLDRLARLTRLPIRYVHVIRNPWDNIATMKLRSEQPGGVGPGPGSAGIKGGASLARTIDTYTLLCATVEGVMERVGPAAVFNLRHEDLLADPRGRLGALTGFLGLDPSEEYLAACAGILFESPNQTRHRIEWPADLSARVEDLTGRFAFLGGYGFSDGHVGTADENSPGGSG